jgi:hypothetical protein
VSESPMRHPPRDRNNKICDGPPKKRSPALVVSKRRANRNSDRHSHPNNKETDRKTQESDRSLSLYDGRDRLASITGQVGDFIVVMADGGLLGSFKTLGQARAAISAAHGGVR